MTGVGRPPIGDRIEVRLPAATLDELDRLAAGTGVKRAELVRSIVTNYLAELSEFYDFYDDEK